jgi:phenylalanine-4-hydroxylase
MELFKPEWGIYDMAIGAYIISAFAGPADPDAFGLHYPAPEEKTHHIEHTEVNRKLFGLYSSVSAARNNGSDTATFIGSWEILKKEFPDEWLLPLEIAEELTKQNDVSGTIEEIVSSLRARSEENEEMQKLIGDGLLLITDQQQH